MNIFAELITCIFYKNLECYIDKTYSIIIKRNLILSIQDSSQIGILGDFAFDFLRVHRYAVAPLK